MAESSESRKSESKARMRTKYSVDEEQENEWMIQYTKIYSYELTFVVDLMEFVMEEDNQHFKDFIYPNCLGRPSLSYFDDSVKKFVKLTLANVKADAVNMLETHLNLDKPSYSEFKAYANAAALKVESSSYSEHEFLVFCVLMSQMSTVAYIHGIYKAPDFGIMLMCRTFSSFRQKQALPADPLNDIQRIARETAQLLELEAQRSVDKKDV